MNHLSGERSFVLTSCRIACQTGVYIQSRDQYTSKISVSIIVYHLLLQSDVIVQATPPLNLVKNNKKPQLDTCQQTYNLAQLTVGNIKNCPVQGYEHHCKYISGQCVASAKSPFIFIKKLALRIDLVVFQSYTDSLNRPVIHIKLLISCKILFLKLLS